MRIVVDTNNVVSGLYWHGPSRQVLDTARVGTIQLFTSAALLAELEDVLERDKFAQRLALIGVAPRELAVGYAALATLVRVEAVPPVVAADPDDDAVLACAVAARADAIVTGDHHLLELAEYEGIRIVTATDFLLLLSEWSLP